MHEQRPSWSRRSPHGHSRRTTMWPNQTLPLNLLGKNMKMKIAALFAITIAVSLFGQSAGPTMKAIVVHQFGGPEVLKLEDAPKPDPKEDEILVKVISAGVNSFDGGLRSGKWAKVFKIDLPWIPGYDIAGTVEKVGGKVTKFKVGDPVYA